VNGPRLSPHADPARIARSVANGSLRHEEGQLEKRCGRCQEWWPADLEFFYPKKDGPAGLHSLCKACYGEPRKDGES
jgi:hypothetical protein